MKIYDGGIILIIAICAIAAAVAGTSYYILGPDNAVEEVAEKVVEAETGTKIDFTPAKIESPSESPSHC